MFARNEEAKEKCGRKDHTFCNSGWNSEHWLYWGVEEFPSMEAVQEFAKCPGDSELIPIH